MSDRRIAGDKRSIEMAQKQQGKYSKDPLERTIQMREAGIKRMQARKDDIRRQAENECAEIDKSTRSASTR